MHPATVSIFLFILSVVFMANELGGAAVLTLGIMWLYLVHCVCTWFRRS